MNMKKGFENKRIIYKIYENTKLNWRKHEKTIYKYFYNFIFTFY